MDYLCERKFLEKTFDEIRTLYDGFCVTSVAVHEKGSRDLVTDLDFQIERLLIDRITDAFPNDNIVSEEFNPTKPLKERNWVIDPLDGTVNFALGSALYGTQVALLEGDAPRLSFILLPALSMLCTAERGQGAFINGKRLLVNKNARAENTILSFGDFSKHNEAFAEYQMKLFTELRRRFMRLRVFGSSAYDFATMANGNCSAHLMHTKNPWDVFPGRLLCEEAGAIFAKADGSPYETYFPSLCVCASQNILDSIVSATEAVNGLPPAEALNW